MGKSDKAYRTVSSVSSVKVSINYRPKSVESINNVLGRHYVASAWILPELELGGKDAVARQTTDKGLSWQ
jgi:hypothetical protein